MNRIGPHGEIYVTEGTKHQTFRQEAIVDVEKWSTDGPRMLAATLRRLADSIEEYSIKGFVSDPHTDYGKGIHIGPEPITTSLCHMSMWGGIEVPPRHNPHDVDMLWESYRFIVGARLGFE